MKKILPLLIMTTVLWSCNEDNTDPEDLIAERTVLVYVAAENNLNNYATNDIEEMKTGSRSLNDRQNLIVYVDKAGQEEPYFARVKNGILTDTAYVDESLTADPATLEMALQYTIEYYPAKSYGLVLWGHGSGWIISADSIAYDRSRAYGGDTGNGSSSSAGKYWMNIPAIRRAISNGLGQNHLKFVMGDCCSFCCMETAYELREETDYMIGSPAEVPDQGAPFDLIVPDMFLQTDDFYRYIIDHYYNYYLKVFDEQYATYYNQEKGDLKGYSLPLAAIKISEADNLVQATASILGTIADKLSPEGDLDIENTVYYAMYGSQKYSYDMYSVLKNNTAEKDFTVWEAAFQKAVPYHQSSLKWMTAYGKLNADMKNFETAKDDCGAVSMFFPMQAYRNTYPNWNTSIRLFQWNNVIQWEQYGW